MGSYFFILIKISLHDRIKLYDCGAFHLWDNNYRGKTGMKRLVISFFMIVLFMFFLCGNAIPEPIQTYESCPYKEILGCGSGFIYNDAMLFVNENELSTDLAKASMVLARGAYSGEASTMLQEMGYNTTPYNYSDEDLFDNLVAFTVGYRDIPESNTRLICVVIRGTHGTSEWLSNFEIGTDGEHFGFNQAAVNVRSILYDYLPSGKDNILWITGHSRGAAVANILAAHYSDLHYKTFGYTFACPAVSSKIEKTYNNIWNFNNDRDIVPKVPLESWGYQRYGRDYSIYWPSNLTQELEAKVNNVVNISDDYSDSLNRFRLKCVGLILSGSTDVSISDILQSYGEIPELSCVEDLSDVDSLEEFEDRINDRYSSYSENEQYIKEIKAITESMTPEEFDQYIAEHPDVGDRIYSIINKEIQKKRMFFLHGLKSQNLQKMLLNQKMLWKLSLC